MIKRMGSFAMGILFTAVLLTGCFNSSNSVDRTESSNKAENSEETSLNKAEIREETSLNKVENSGESSSNTTKRKTVVSIEGSKFKINGEYVNKGRVWKDIEIEGLLFNTRMVQGIFDDKNPDTVSKWAYPDTNQWDAERNTNEFIEAMPLWKDHGVICFTINLQGGSPEGYSNSQPWHNSAFLENGDLDEKYMQRLEKILDRADELGMIVILGYFYFGQDERLKDETAVIAAATNATKWLLDKGYTNVMVEIANETDHNKYNHSIFSNNRAHELIQLVKSLDSETKRLYVSTSYCGNVVPKENVAANADFLLMHGNSVNNPERIEEMVKLTKSLKNYKGQPILFNEDDHFNFDKEVNNLIKAIKNGASWGYFDPGSSNYKDGYQCPPVNWGINTQRKKDFFNLVKQITQG